MTDDPNKTASWFARFLASGRHWPILLVVLFVTQASIVISTAIIASGPGAEPIDTAYYAKSLQWDQQSAIRRRADELGWTIDIAVGEPIGVPPKREIRATLHDASGDPIEHAVVWMKCFHRSRSTDPSEIVLSPSGSSSYVGSLVVRKGGLWDFTFSVRAQGEDVVFQQLIEIME